MYNRIYFNRHHWDLPPHSLSTPLPLPLPTPRPHFSTYTLPPRSLYLAAPYVSLLQIPYFPHYTLPTSPTPVHIPYIPLPLYLSPASPIPLPIPYLPAPSTRLSPSSPPISRGVRRRNVNTTTTKHSSCVPQYLIAVEMVELKLHRQRQHCMFILNDG